MPVLLSFSAGILLTLAQFALLCSIMCKTDLPASVLGPLSTGAVCIAVLLAGMLLAFLVKRRGMLLGFAQGAAFFCHALDRRPAAGSGSVFRAGLCQADCPVRRRRNRRVSGHPVGGAQPQKALTLAGVCP